MCKLHRVKLHWSKSCNITCKIFESNFDLPILLPSIVEYTSSINLKTKALRKGTQLINLMISEPREFSLSNEILHEPSALISCRDILKYTSPCSLAKFLVQWKTTQQKGAFPHG